jgi:hypothetical protein
MGEYTSKEDQEFFASIGRFTISWSLLEAVLDMSVMSVYHGLGGSKLAREIPKSLKRKIKFLAKASKRIESISHLEKEIGEITNQIKDASVLRHDLIHGFAVEAAEKSGEAKLVRFIHEAGAITQRPIEIDTVKILTAARDNQKLVARFAAVGKELASLCPRM